MDLWVDRGSYPGAKFTAVPYEVYTILLFIWNLHNKIGGKNQLQMIAYGLQRDLSLNGKTLNGHNSYEQKLFEFLNYI